MNQSFSLDPSDDLDIIEWLGDQSNISAAIREAIRKSIKNEPMQNKEVLKTLQELSRQMGELQEKINTAVLRNLSENSKKTVPQGEAVPEDVKENLRSLQV